MSGQAPRAAAEALLRRLRRLVARAATVEPSDCKQIRALLDDVETTRRGLLEERAAVESEMRQTTVRTTAIGAYLRSAQAYRGKRHN